MHGRVVLHPRTQRSAAVLLSHRQTTLEKHCPGVSVTPNWPLNSATSAHLGAAKAGGSQADCARLCRRGATLVPCTATPQGHWGNQHAYANSRYLGLYTPVCPFMKGVQPPGYLNAVDDSCSILLITLVERRLLVDPTGCGAAMCRAYPTTCPSLIDLPNCPARRPGREKANAWRAW